MNRGFARIGMYETGIIIVCVYIIIGTIYREKVINTQKRPSIQYFSGHSPESVGVICDIIFVKFGDFFKVRVQVGSVVDEQMDRVLLAPFRPV